MLAVFLVALVLYVAIALNILAPGQSVHTQRICVLSSALANTSCSSIARPCRIGRPIRAWLHTVSVPDPQIRCTSSAPTDRLRCSTYVCESVVKDASVRGYDAPLWCRSGRLLKSDLDETSTRHLHPLSRFFRQQGGSRIREQEVLSVENLPGCTADGPLVNNVTLQLYQHEKLALVGTNGSGKTTFLQSIVTHWQSRRDNGVEQQHVQGSVLPWHPLAGVEARGINRSKGTRNGVPKGKMVGEKDAASPNDSLLRREGTYDMKVRVAYAGRVSLLRQEGLEGLSSPDASQTVRKELLRHMDGQRDTLQRQLHQQQAYVDRLEAGKEVGSIEELDLSPKRNRDGIANAIMRLSWLQQDLTDCQSCVFIELLLKYLGFGSKELQQQILGTLSGGERMRLLLAKALSELPTLLLLDEPTNHSDAETAAALRQLLKELPLPMIIASHDKKLLRDVCTGVILMDNGRCSPKYIGSFDSFVEHQQQQYTQWTAAVRRRQKELRVLQQQRHSNPVTAAKLRQIEELMQPVPPPQYHVQPKKPPQFRFPEQHDRGRELITLVRCTLGVWRLVPLAHTHPLKQLKRQHFVAPETTDETVKSHVRVLLSDVNISIRGGSKIAIVGPNGCGKSTLLKALAGNVTLRTPLHKVHYGEETWTNFQTHTVPPILIGGERITTDDVESSIFYLPQHHADALSTKSTAIEVAAKAKIQSWKRCGDGDDAGEIFPVEGRTDYLHEEELLGALGRVGLRGRSVYRPIQSLSGGEKARLSIALSLLSSSSCSVLFLDEPTNHLDEAAISALVASLQTFSGAFVCVTHDATFAASVANEILVIDPVTRMVSPLREHPNVVHDNNVDSTTSHITRRRNSAHNAAASGTWKDLWLRTLSEAQQKLPRIDGSVRTRGSNSIGDVRRKRNYGGKGTPSGKIKGVKNFKRWK